ncbi:hypothetical protein ONS95_014556 [Cadophora gregata]|uniref:uncharacterized protein n=1 Tax=Cadophora gregata TaxID=51156 RepID=UPI0026DB172D|nr:uncharacterized protein ONS95_014556 [Cadophora gregata]KAK0112829.1 hypothetical protein ONS95_014556 [Cadophora gregata]KAK0124919.1 hypothetical protein ONS96_008795 [Cadophora gregata f. sp. sojae]
MSQMVANPTRSRMVSSGRAFDPQNPYENWPSYAELPLDPSYPTKAAWGVWGADDVHGALNHITQVTIKTAATEEIQTGQAFNLNLELNFIPRPILARRKPTIHLVKPGPQSNDDVITLNTQASTQLDGLRHYPYSEPVENRSRTYRFYNDLITNYEEIIGGNMTDVLGIQQAADKGIAARGILLDYKGWMDSKNMSFDPLKAHAVAVSDLDKVAEWQGLKGDWARPGDILLVRFGWIEAFSKLDDNQRQAIVLGSGEYIGVPASPATAEWLWSKKLAMVGGDNPAFEEHPVAVQDFDGEERSLHQIMISGKFPYCSK